MSHVQSREVVLAVKITDELIKRLDTFHEAWRQDAHSIPKGLSCSESKDGQFVLVAAESAFTTIPGACIIKGVGAIELLGAAPTFDEGASSKTLVLRNETDGWRFSVKFVAPKVRERKAK